MIKMLIVDDSSFFRKIFRDILQKDDDIIIVGEARNGKEALEQISALSPDLITLDIEMPIMDGITTLINIMKSYNIPVIMLTSYTDDNDIAIKSLEEGAVDFIQKPKNIFNIDEDEIIKKIKVAANSNLKTNNNFSIKKETPKKNLSTKSIPYTRRLDNNNFKYIVTIGVSTGGPKALQEVIPLLPKDINASILVVQHMPPNFTKSLADRLDKISEINVKEGEDGDKLERGWCYIAPGDFHMKVAKENRSYVIKLDKSAEVKSLRPSVDVLMESVATECDLDKIGVILTGMGDDGSKGVVKLKEANGYIISQDEETSTVFGMPKAAINTNCVDKILPLNFIADEIIRIVGV